MRDDIYNVRIRTQDVWVARRHPRPAPAATAHCSVIYKQFSLTLQFGMYESLMLEITGFTTIVVDVKTGEILYYL